jgi:hypothetical protein
MFEVVGGDFLEASPAEVPASERFLTSRLQFVSANMTAPKPAISKRVCLVLAPFTPTAMPGLGVSLLRERGRSRRPLRFRFWRKQQVPFVVLEAGSPQTPRNLSLAIPLSCPRYREIRLRLWISGRLSIMVPPESRFL